MTGVGVGLASLAGDSATGLDEAGRGVVAVRGFGVGVAGSSSEGSKPQAATAATIEATRSVKLNQIAGEVEASRNDERRFT
jgi:hypothetical protein